MTRQFLAPVLAALLAAGAAGAALARPLSILDAAALTRDADVIVVGRVTAARYASAVAPARPEGVLSVSAERVLKGALPSLSTPVSVRLDLAGVDDVLVSEGQYGIFFLDRAGGEYTPVSRDYPALPASEAAGPASASGPAHALRGVADELLAALAAPAEISGDPLLLQIAYENIAAALGSLPPELTRDGLRRLATSGQPLTKLWASACLLRTGDAAALPEAAKALLDPPPALDYSAAALAIAIESGLGVSGSNRQAGLASPALVGVFAELLHSRVVEARRAGAAALKEIATPAAARALASVAMRDKDRDVRYYAVTGLYRAAGERGAPSVALFHREETRFVEAAARLRP